MICCEKHDDGCADKAFKCCAPSCFHFDQPATGHKHEWQPAGVTEPRYNDEWTGITFVWGMCKCGEITVRQWAA